MVPQILLLALIYVCKSAEALLHCSFSRCFRSPVDLWSQLPSKSSDGINSAFLHRISAASTPNEALILIRGLASGPPIQGLSDRDKYSLALVLHEHVSSKTPLNVALGAELIWCLGTLGFDAQQAEVSMMVDAVTHSLVTAPSIILKESNCVPKILVGIARLQAEDHVSLLDEDVLSAVEISLPQMRPRALGNTVWALGKMGLSKHAVGAHENNGVWNGIMLRLAHTDVGPHLNEQSLSNLLLGLARMGARWVDLPLLTRESIEASIARLCLRMTSQGLGLTVYSLGQLGVSQQGGSLSQTIEVAVELAIRQRGSDMAMADLIQCLVGMGKMSFQWQRLSELTRQSLAYAVYRQGMSWTSGGAHKASQVSSVLHALGRMGCMWTDLPSATRGALLVGLRAFGDVDGAFEDVGKLSLRQRNRQKMLDTYGHALDGSENIDKQEEPNPLKQQNRQQTRDLQGTAGDASIGALQKELDQLQRLRMATTNNSDGHDEHKDEDDDDDDDDDKEEREPSYLNFQDDEEGLDVVEGIDATTVGLLSDLRTTDGVASTSGRVGLQALSNTLTALSTMGLTWTTLKPDDISEGLVKCVLDAMEAAQRDSDDACTDGQGVATLMYGVAALSKGVSVPQGITKAFLERLVTLPLSSLDAQTAATLVFSVLTLAAADAGALAQAAGVGFDTSTKRNCEQVIYLALPVAARRRVETLGCMHCHWPKMDPRGIGLMLRGLVNTGASWAVLRERPELMTVLVQYIYDWMQNNGSPMFISPSSSFPTCPVDRSSAQSTLTSLGRMGWFPTDIYTRDCGVHNMVSSSSTSSCVLISPAYIASALVCTALHGSFGPDKEGGATMELPTDPATAVDVEVVPGVPTVGQAAPSIPAILIGLGGMVPGGWSDLSDTARDVIIAAISSGAWSNDWVKDDDGVIAKEQEELTNIVSEAGEEVGRVLYSLGRLGCSWVSLSTHTQKVLLSAMIERPMTSRSIGHVLIGFREMGTTLLDVSDRHGLSTATALRKSIMSAVRQTLNGAPVVALVTTVRGLVALGMQGGRRVTMEGDDCTGDVNELLAVPRDVLRALLRLSIISADPDRRIGRDDKGSYLRTSSVAVVLTALTELCAELNESDVALVDLWQRAREALLEGLCTSDVRTSREAQQMVSLLVGTGVKWFDLSHVAKQSIMRASALVLGDGAASARMAEAFHTLGATAINMADCDGDAWAFEVLAQHRRVQHRRRDGSVEGGLTQNSYIVAKENMAMSSSSESSSSKATCSSFLAAVQTLVMLGFPRAAERSPASAAIWESAVVDLAEMVIAETWNADASVVAKRCRVLSQLHARVSYGKEYGVDSGIFTWKQETRRMLVLILEAHVDRLIAYSSSLCPRSDDGNDHGGNDDDDDDEDDDGAVDVLLARGLRSGFAVLLACSGSREGRLLWTALPSRPRNSLGMALAELLRGEEGGSRAVSSRVVALALGKMGARYAKLPNQLRQALEKGLSYSTDDRDEILALLAWPEEK